MWKKSIGQVATSIAMLGLASAQQPVEQVTVRVLPLGNRPPFVQEVRGNMRQEIDAPEGSLPPGEISVGIPAPEGEEKKADKLMHLRLGEVSEAVAMPKIDPPTVTLRDPAANKIWLKQTLGTTKSTLLVVWRPGDKWNEPRCLPLDDSTEAIPRDGIRVVNVAPVEMKMIWGEQRLRLLPGKAIVLRFPEGSKTAPFQILFTDTDNKLKPCLNTTAELDTGSRRQWFVFKDDRTATRMPVQVVPLSEPRTAQ
ncbi:hypothetical protein [Luteolibacter soli]|uniref:Uncharacterized protein n=1 Tax=Luteolibacter soli TaxID=3135280 RepID=A0ABU9B3E0_9BACT